MSVTEPAVVLMRAIPPPPVLAADAVEVLPTIVESCSVTDPLPLTIATPSSNIERRCQAGIGSAAPLARQGG